jgi:hypothetical protein
MPAAFFIAYFLSATEDTEIAEKRTIQLISVICVSSMASENWFRCRIVIIRPSVGTDDAIR